MAISSRSRSLVREAKLAAVVKSACAAAKRTGDRMRKEARMRKHAQVFRYVLSRLEGGK